MKKILFSFLAFTLLTSVSIANCCEDCQKTVEKYPCKQQSTCEKKNPCFENKGCEDKTPLKEKSCDRCSIDDDEYCVYNQCFFDKQFRSLKRTLCLTKKQETCIDNIYRNFKSDMETTHNKYRIEKNKLLEMIACENDCYKEQTKALKEIRKSAKEKCKDFRGDVKEQLCKNQYSEFRRFQRAEKRKLKKLVKYGAIYKFPCVDCCTK